MPTKWPPATPERKPTHLLAYVDAPRTMCGIDVRDDKALPLLWSFWWPAHRLGYNPPLCPDCERELPQ